MCFGIERKTQKIQVRFPLMPEIRYRKQVPVQFHQHREFAVTGHGRAYTSLERL